VSTNVLFVLGEQATLVRGDQTATGPVSTLRALARRINARGPTVLVLSGVLHPADAPPDLPDDQRLALLDSRHAGPVALHPHAPDHFLSAHDPAALTRATAAAKPAGLRVTRLMPLTSCALRAAGSPASAIVIHPHEDAFDTAIISVAQVKSHTQATNGRLDLTRVISTALSRPLSSGDTPQVIVLGPPQETGPLPGGLTPQFLTLEAALAGALLPIPAPDPEHPAPGHLVAGLQRRHEQRARIPRSVYGGLAVALAVNGGVLLWAASLRNGNVRLEERRVYMQQQAAETLALRAANADLEARITQARNLTENKGPLGRDLPLLASRVTEVQARLTSLSGPNTPTEADARAFGQAVDRTYDLVAETPDPEELTRAYQARGLSADVRDVDCTASPCKVTFRAAPTAPLTPMTPSATPAAASQPAATPRPEAP
jgi:hypothetical protein